MSTVAKFGRKTIQIANGLLNAFVLLVILVILSFSFYSIWDSSQIYGAASSINYEIYKPTAESETTSFADLQAINPDVFAWITVYGTNIDYPLVQGSNNMKYVNTDARGRHSISGAIFMDYRSDPNFSDFSSIIYGHHMENQVMFGEIALFSDKSYFNARRYGVLYVNGQEYGMEFFAFVHTDAYDFEVFRVGITDPEEKSAYLELLMQIAMHSRPEISVTATDRIVLLSTCSPNSTNGRDILVAKITDTIFSDPFETEEPNPTQIFPTIDEFHNFWNRIPQFVKNGIATILLLLILLTVSVAYTKRPR